jgi:Ca2+-binding EF-hand superfamily protein
MIIYDFSLFINIFCFSLQCIDNGSLSRDEFHAYFRDAVLNERDLDYLFDSIDVDKSGEIDINELIRMIV